MPILRRPRARFAILALILAACGSGTDDGDDELGQLDPRCESLCSESDVACEAAVAQCLQVCQIRTAELSALCAACLLDGAHAGTCIPGAACCPDPEFPNSVLDCAAACAEPPGVNPPGGHPICDDLCSSSDSACSAAASQCLQACNARVSGVSGVCALCLLEDANAGACPVGGTCCPDPQFPTSPSACASVCAS